MIDFIYGGPNVKDVSHSFSGGLCEVLPHAFAQPGFIVVTVDARDTVSREALMQAGKPYDLVVFPESTCSVTGRARSYWLDAGGGILLSILI